MEIYESKDNSGLDQERLDKIGLESIYHTPNTVHDAADNWAAGGED